MTAPVTIGDHMNVGSMRCSVCSKKTSKGVTKLVESGRGWYLCDEERHQEEYRQSLRLFIIHELPNVFLYGSFWMKIGETLEYVHSTYPRYIPLDTGEGDDYVLLVRSDTHAINMYLVDSLRKSTSMRRVLTDEINYLEGATHMEFISYMKNIICDSTCIYDVAFREEMIKVYRSILKQAEDP